MKIKYFEDTDTALWELSTTPPSETRERSEDVYLDLDAEGQVVSITVNMQVGEEILTNLPFSD